MNAGRGNDFTVFQAPLQDLSNNVWGVVNVYIEAVKSPDLIVIQRAELIPNLRILENNIRLLYEEVHDRYPDKPNPKKLIKGRCYAIYSQRKRRWIRARADEDVRNVTAHRVLTKFHLMDYYTDEYHFPNRARYLPSSFCRLPAVGYMACVSDPYTGPPREWTLQEIKDFREQVSGKIMACKPRKYHPVRQLNMVRFLMDADGTEGSNGSGTLINDSTEVADGVGLRADARVRVVNETGVVSLDGVGFVMFRRNGRRSGANALINTVDALQVLRADLVLRGRLLSLGPDVVAVEIQSVLDARAAGVPYEFGGNGPTRYEIDYQMDRNSSGDQYDN